MRWTAIAVFVVAVTSCRESPRMTIESNSYRMEIADDYSGVTLYFDGDYMPPSAERQPTEEEFHAAHDVIAKHLNLVGKATEKVDEYKDADFTLSRYFDPRAAINVVSDLHSPKVIEAVVAAQKELKGAFAINLDSHPAYVSVVPDGRVIGHADDERSAEATAILQAYGFDFKTNGEQGGDGDAEEAF